MVKKFWRGFSLIVVGFILGFTCAIYLPSVLINFKYYDIARKVANAIDSENPYTREFAAFLAKEYPGEFNFNQVCLIYDFIRANWKYIDDPKGSEYFALASQTIGLELAGDCDDFAIVMAAALKAIGADVRVVFTFSQDGGHAYAEVNIGEDLEKNIDVVRRHYSFFFIPLKDPIFYHSAEDGTWLNLDWSAEHPGGPYSEWDNAIAIYPNGKFVRLVHD